MAELMPCPFCGGAAVIWQKAPGGTMSSGMEPHIRRVGCTGCGAGFDWRHPKEEWGNQHKHDMALVSELTSLWNTRAKAPEPQ